MPQYLSIGVSKQEFMDSNPVELAPYIKAYKIKMEEMDRMAWSMCGNYVLSAVSVAVEHCLNGRKAKSKYIEQPISKNIEEEKEDWTEEELQKQRELFVAKLLVMQSNFELNHKKGSDKNGEENN